MFITNFEYCGITISITTNWEVYHDFVNLYLKHFVSTSDKEPTLRIQSLFPISSEDQLCSFPFLCDNLRKVGRNVYFDERRIYYQQGNCNVFAQFDGNDGLSIYCIDSMRLWKRGGFKTTAMNIARKVFLRRLSEVYGTFQTHMRLTFHFPLFWLIESHHGFHLLHAAVVRINGDCIIFSGLASVGKTTLATFLYSNYPGTDILTDNFLLYDCERIYGFPEASRLSNQGIEIASAQSLLSDTFVLGHRLHWLPRKPDPIDAVPKKAFLVCLGKSMRVEPITADLFTETALGLNDVVKEFHNYNYVSLFPFATCRSFDIHVSRVRSLKSCLQNVDCAVLTIPDVSNLSDIRQDILNVILPPVS